MYHHLSAPIKENFQKLARLFKIYSKSSPRVNEFTSGTLGPKTGLICPLSGTRIVLLIITQQAIDLTPLALD